MVRRRRGIHILDPFSKGQPSTRLCGARHRLFDLRRDLRHRSDSVTQNENYEVWVDRALKYHGFEFYGFRAWLVEQNVSIETLNEDHLYDYHQELVLAGKLEMLVEHLSNEVFHVLFANRKLLANFNEFMARILQLYFDNIPPSELGIISNRQAY